MEEDVPDRIKSQMAMEFIGTLTNALESKCFTRCIKKPGVKLEKADEACLSRCMDRYLEAWGITSQSVNRIQLKLSQMNEK